VILTACVNLRPTAGLFNNGLDVAKTVIFQAKYKSFNQNSC